MKMLSAFTVGTNKVHVKVDGREKEKVSVDNPKLDYTLSSSRIY